MHSGSAACQRHIHAIVDQDAGACSSRQGDDIGHCGRQIGRVEVALANLDEVDPGINGVPCLPQETRSRGPGIITLLA